MKLKYQIIIFFIGIMMTPLVNAQNFEKHQWKNRIVLIISSDSKSNIYASQCEEFTKGLDEFSKRKVIIYKILPNKYKRDEESWTQNTSLYKAYNANSSDFKIVLIGLDGRIKLSQNKLLSRDHLFNTIDAMPMRKNELKNK
ncbi:DUF4174 domain-containing protein [Winogradskyella sp.]|uniref:DUF4174 domain-containing protein n=1 Tax=Winogradskyella sp. TaxID=1883156 RepID=UPI00386F0103